MKKFILSFVLSHRQRYIINQALECYKPGATPIGKDQIIKIQELFKDAKAN